MLKTNNLKLKIALTVINLFLVSVSVYAQNLKTMVGGALKRELQNQAEKITQKPVTALIINDKRITLSSENLNCDSKVNTFNYIRTDMVILKFWDADVETGKSCRDDDQWIKSSKSKHSIGSWEMLFFSNPKTQSIVMSLSFSDSVIKFVANDDRITNKENVKSRFIKYSLVGNSVYILNANSVAEMKEKENKKDIGNFALKIENGKIFDKENKVACGYEGENNFDILKLYTGRNFVIVSSKISELLDAFVAEREQAEYERQQQLTIKKNIELAKEYIKTEKKCMYCNNLYKGESFDFKKFRSRSKPCADEVVKVYYDKFCSRKCAIDHCISTH